MGDVKFVHSSGGYISLMKSGAMRGVLREHADRIKGSAESALSPDKGTPLYSDPYQTVGFATGERAGVRIQTANDHAMNAEREHGILQSAAGV